MAKRHASKNLRRPAMPDEARRRDMLDAEMPGVVPRSDEYRRSGGMSPSEDGGLADHPIHDDDFEDLGPEDYEELTDVAAKLDIKD